MDSRKMSRESGLRLPRQAAPVDRTFAGMTLAETENRIVPAEKSVWDLVPNAVKYWSCVAAGGGLYRCGVESGTI
jgi:hypothetical protein